MKELFFDDDELVFDDENIIMTDEGTFKLEPGDPGYVDPAPQPASIKKARNYMASNPTAEGLNELIADGERLCDGLHELGVVIGISRHPEAATRADLEDLKAKQAAFDQAQTDETAASEAEQAADEAGAKFIGQFAGWMALHIGGQWSDAWVGTGLPDNSTGVPKSKAKRLAALDKINVYLTNNPQFELTHPLLVITAARAHALHEAISDAEQVTNAKEGLRKTAKVARDAADRKFRTTYRKTVSEIGECLGPEDGRWANFGLSRPADPESPEAPRNLKLEVRADGLVIATVGGARRASSFNFYKQVVGVDPEPVKVDNTTETHMNIAGLPAGATVKVTATGVNDAGEGPACAAVSAVVT